MRRRDKTATILIAEDDSDDRMLAEQAFAQANLSSELRMVEDGEELMEYLHGSGKQAAAAEAPLPSLILLDLNMPRKDGREALREIKNDPRLRYIPVVVLTTSEAKEDIAQTYRLGVNSYVTKPVAFDELVRLMKLMEQYWLETVQLPT